jgi:hypothetical protein
MDIRDTKSVLTEWILKFAIIFFIASLFFDPTIIETFSRSEAFKLGIIIKIIIIAIYGILLSVLEKNMFKIIGFSSIIAGSFFKILIYMSSDNFPIENITQVADFALLIIISIYYLYRHFRHTKKYQSSRKKKATPEEMAS